MMYGHKKVSVVICTYSHNRFRDTIETFYSLYNQTYPNVEIILIIDRNVTLFNKFNESFLYGNFPHKFKIGLSTLSGLSNARNKGVEFATGDIIAFIDDDAIADPNWIANLVKCYSNSSIVGAGGPMKPLWLSGKANWIPEEFYWTMGCSYKSQQQKFHDVRSNFGSNMSFVKDVFEHVGNFDDNYGLVDSKMKTGEETEFSIRVLKYYENKKIVFTPEAIVYHKIFDFRKSFSFIFKRCYSYGVAISRIGSSKKVTDEKLESTEKNFLKYLLYISFFERFGNIVKNNQTCVNLLNVFSLFILTFAVGAGFLIEKTIKIKL